jgi:hypothetical protein
MNFCLRRDVFFAVSGCDTNLGPRGEMSEALLGRSWTAGFLALVGSVQCLMLIRENPQIQRRVQNFQPIGRRILRA